MVKDFGSRESCFAHDVVVMSKVLHRRLFTTIIGNKATLFSYPSSILSDRDQNERLVDDFVDGTLSRANADQADGLASRKLRKFRIFPSLLQWGQKQYQNTLLSGWTAEITLALDYSCCTRRFFTCVTFI